MFLKAEACHEGLRTQDSGPRTQDSGLRTQDPGLKTQDPRMAGLLLIISGPSGVGKTTITHEVERMLGGQFSV